MTGSRKNGKLLGIVAALIVLVVVVEVYFGFVQHHEVANNVKIDGVFLAKAKEINNFHLSDNKGKSFDKSNLNGQWTMMFFGFTNCAMVCPTTMAALSDMYKRLEKELPKNQLPQIVFVSVDPERDTIKRMNDYVTTFNPNFKGARAEIAETVALEKQLNIVAAKIQADGADKNQYSINHSAEILLFNPKGQLQAYLSYPHQAQQMASDYKLIIKSLS